MNGRMLMGKRLRRAPTHGPALVRWAYSWKQVGGVVGILEDAVDSLRLMPGPSSYPDAVERYPLDVLSEAIEAAEATTL